MLALLIDGSYSRRILPKNTQLCATRIPQTSLAQNRADPPPTRPTTLESCAVGAAIPLIETEVPVLFLRQLLGTKSNPPPR